MYFRKYGLQKTCLNKCLKSFVPADLWTSNIVNRTKDFSNLNDTTFSIIIDHCKGNCFGKNLS